MGDFFFKFCGLLTLILYIVTISSVSETFSNNLREGKGAELPENIIATPKRIPPNCANLCELAHHLCCNSNDVSTFFKAWTFILLRLLPRRSMKYHESALFNVFFCFENCKIFCVFSHEHCCCNNGKHNCNLSANTSQVSVIKPNLQ